MMDRVATRIAVGVIALTTVGAPLALPTIAGASTPATSRDRDQPPAGAAREGVGARDRRPRRTTRCGRATRSGASPRNAWPTAPTGRRSPRSTSGATMDGGTRFVDPDHVRAGWRLRLPPTTDGEAREAAPAGHAPRASAHDHGDRLPELVALGMGSLACAALARRARSRRRIDPFTGDLELPRAVSDEAMDAAALLHRFAEVPALHSFEAANCLLGRSLHGDPAGPVVRAICVSPSGVTFWLTEPRADAPDGFVLRHDGAAWHVDHTALRDEDTLSPYVPIALPIGEDDDGSWLVALGPGSVLPLLGESALELERSARSAACAWAWSDTVLVTDDPDDLELGAGGPHGRAAPPVLR